MAAHGLDLAEVERLGWANALISSTYASRHGGRRYKAIGYLDGRLVSVIFARLGLEAISVISLRVASRSERTVYENSQEEEGL
jgi:uncharacterized DUF497 family protein